MTAEQRALHLAEKKTGERCVVLFWSDDGLIKVVRKGRVTTCENGFADFGGQPLSVVRWASRHFNVNVIYLVRSDDDHVRCKRYVRMKS